ncbi:MAG: hypothetical protein ABSE59_06750, partial [Opitutaceae bacterium]
GKVETENKRRPETQKSIQTNFLTEGRKGNEATAVGSYQISKRSAFAPDVEFSTDYSCSLRSSIKISISMIWR